MPATKQFDPDQALDRAMHVFWSRGYESTSLEDLVRATRVNRASLYTTFGSKRALFLSALRRYDKRCRRQRLEKLERSFTPKRAIRELFESWIDQALEHGDQRGCLLANTAVEMAGGDEQVGTLVAESQRDTERFLHALIERGQADGEIAAGIDAERAAKTLLATLLGLLVLVRSRPEPGLLHAIVDEAVGAL